MFSPDIIDEYSDNTKQTDNAKTDYLFNDYFGTQIVILSHTFINYYFLYIDII
jgi:hypothetical protein